MRVHSITIRSQRHTQVEKSTFRSRTPNTSHNITKVFVDPLKFHQTQSKSGDKLISTTVRLEDARLGFDYRQTKEIFVSALHQVTQDEDGSENRCCFIFRVKQTENHDYLTMKTEEFRLFERPVTNYQSTWHHFPQYIFTTYFPR